MLARVLAVRDVWFIPMKALLALAVLVAVASACGSSSEQVVTGTVLEPTPTAVEPTPTAPEPTAATVAAVEPTVTAVVVEPTPTVTAVVVEPTAATVAAVEPTVTAVVVEPTPTVTAVVVEPTPTVTAVVVEPTPTVTAVVVEPEPGTPNAVAVPNSVEVLRQFDEPPAGVPLCVVGIVAPDTLNIRSGPGVEYAIRGALRPDACILRSAGAPRGAWQPIHAVVAADELLVLEGWVSSTYVLPAVAVSTAEAAVAFDSAVLSIGARGGDPLLVVPCETVAAGLVSCEVTDWFWEVASSPCASRPVDYWKLGTAGMVEARQAADGSWSAQAGPRLVLDC